MAVFYQKSQLHKNPCRQGERTLPPPIKALIANNNGRVNNNLFKRFYLHQCICNGIGLPIIATLLMALSQF